MPIHDDPAHPLADVTVDAAGGVSSLISAIDEAVDAQRDLEQELRREFQTNNTDFRALLLVFRMQRRGRPIHPGDLTRGLGLSSGTGAQIINRLTTAGLLVRAPDPADARAGLLTLTDEAADRLAQSTEALRRDLDEILGTVSATEEERMIDLLRQIERVFRSHRVTRASMRGRTCSASRDAHPVELSSS